MIEIVIHGRGGQGAVTAAKILASAALEDGKFSTYRPGFFAAERQGAPVKAFVRIFEADICLRHKIEKADGIVILDPTLITQKLIDFENGLKEDAWIVINADAKSSRFSEIIGNLPWSRLPNIWVINAVGLALKHGLGEKIINSAILGVLANRRFSLATLESLEKAVRKIAPRKIEENIAALREAFSSANELSQGGKK